MKLWIVVSVSLLSTTAALANGRAFGGGLAAERFGERASRASADRGTADRGTADRGAAPRGGQPVTPKPDRGNFDKPMDCKIGQCGAAGLNR